MMNFRSMLKLGVAAALLSLAFYFGLIDLRLLLLLDGAAVLLVCALLFGGLIMSSIRWLILMRRFAPHLPFTRVLQINFIGMFFNLFLPGGVGGDLVRARYIITETRSNKSAGVVSILFDRYIGLMGTVYAAAFLTTLLIDDMMANPVLSTVAVIVYGAALTTSVALFAGLYLTDQVLGWRALQTKEDDGRVKALVRKLITAIAAYRHQTWPNFLGIAFSLLTQTCVLSTFVVLADGLGFGDLSGAVVALSAAVASLFSIIPISPGGLGVGEAAFATFCELFKEGQLTASVATIFFAFRAFNIPFALLGGIIFVVFKGSSSRNDFEIDSSRTLTSDATRKE